MKTAFYRTAAFLMQVAAATIILSGSVARAQLFQWGVKAGVPLTDYLDATTVPFNSMNLPSFTSSTNRYTVGPTVELSLPFHLGVEVDALYKRYRFDGTEFGVDNVSYETTTADSWEFPILLKYKLPFPGLHPFVDAGVSLHRVTNVQQVSTGILFPSTMLTEQTTDNPPQLARRSNEGFVIGAGVDIPLLLVHLSPEIRYTRWGSEIFHSPTGELDSNENQAEVLLGITF